MAELTADDRLQRLHATAIVDDDSADSRAPTGVAVRDKVTSAIRSRLPARLLLRMVRR
ncbi:MAG: hypothetical protein H0V17_33910 [Deltaproteobacteria bacterium]|nr:hypothetical protein [Deltaproteobacteria bacterium]